ncbi:hypothetical protein AB837_00364 [bacterium AB1]|nr:hypothetical protein AB837_00364 [bacterium AB1]
MLKKNNTLEIEFQSFDDIVSYFNHNEYSGSIDLNKLYICKQEILIRCFEFLLTIENLKLTADKDQVLYSKKELIRNLIILFVSKKYKIIGSGIIDVNDESSYAFIRLFVDNTIYGAVSHVISEDIFISGKIVKKYGIRKGDEILYSIDEPGSAEKRSSINEILQINRKEINKYNFNKRPRFNECRSCHPYERINFANTPINKNTDIVLLRTIDLLAPAGFGQRALIYAPPKCGKTYLFMQLAESILNQYNNVKMFILLVGERPEEITGVFNLLGKKARIFFSDFSESHTRHIYVVEACIEHAKRLCEMGENVVIFMDSLTRLARAYNAGSPHTGKSLSGGLDAVALHYTKTIFGTARKTIEAGSITIYATSLVEMGGSKLEEIVNQEGTSVSNCDIKLKHGKPNIDSQSSTRMFHLLCKDEKEVQALNNMRSFIKYNNNNSMVILTEMIKETKNNKELFDNRFNSNM